METTDQQSNRIQHNDRPSPHVGIYDLNETGQQRRRSSLEKPRKKRVTIQSETTILILHEPGTILIRRNDPYFTKGCGKYVRWVANADIVLSILEVICCSIAVAYAFVILEEPGVPSTGSYTGRELLHAIITLGFMLMLCYFGEMWVAHRLLSLMTEAGQDRHEALNRSRWWRCSNFVLAMFEIFFGISSVVGGSRTQAGSGVLLGASLRVVGICVLHQFIQELDTVAVTPVVVQQRSGSIEGSNNDMKNGNNFKDKVARTMAEESRVQVPLEPMEFLEKQQQRSTAKPS